MTSVTSNSNTDPQTVILVNYMEGVLRIIRDGMGEMTTNLRELQETIRVRAWINQDVVAKIDLLINNYNLMSEMTKHMMEQADQSYMVLEKDFYNFLEKLDEEEHYMMMGEEN